MNSYLEATARERVQQILNRFSEMLPPAPEWTSPHLPVLNAPVSFDDGIVTGVGQLGDYSVFIAAQEGGFMGGAVGEVHGAKLTGLLRRAVRERPDAVLLLAESGGVRLHEANAGLIAVSEIIRALFEVRAAGIPVIVLTGGANGCFGGMGIVARCANRVIMSELARLAMSGPEVIESAHGVEEWDARDRALIWRTTGGKHRYLLGDCDYLVEDDIAAFRQAAVQAIADCRSEGAALTLAALEAEHQQLSERWEQFSACREPMEIWSALGVAHPEQLALLDAAAMSELKSQLKAALKPTLKSELNQPAGEAA